MSELDRLKVSDAVPVVCRRGIVADLSDFETDEPSSSNNKAILDRDFFSPRCVSSRTNLAPSSVSSTLSAVANIERDKFSVDMGHMDMDRRRVSLEECDSSVFSCTMELSSKLNSECRDKFEALGSFESSIRNSSFVVVAGCKSSGFSTVWTYEQE
jgi:hypothetical protein